MDESIFKESGALKIQDMSSLPLLGQGNTAEIYQYDEKSVIKLYRDSFPVQGIIKEYEINRRVQDVYPNMPKALNVVSWKSRFGILYEKVSGQDMFSAMRGSISAIHKSARELASIHAGIHERRISGIIPVKDKLIGEISVSRDLTEDEKAGVIRTIHALPEQDRLCHFDFHPGNIMYTDSGYRVIDWMTACVGDPASDIARTWLLLKYGELRNIGFLAHIGLKIVKLLIRDRYLAESLRLSGITKEEVGKWMIPVAAARLSEWLTDHERKKLIALVRTGRERSL